MFLYVKDIFEIYREFLHLDSFHFASVANCSAFVSAKL